MPTLWRYLLGQYTKIFILSVFSFIAILLIMRLEQIARFAALGGAQKKVFLFVLYQIPYILPIAIPISCLIASVILFQRLSHTHELSALRAAGLALRQIATPIFLGSAFLVLISFYTISELSTTSHFATKRLTNELTSVNPLALLQKKQFLNLKEVYLEMNTVEAGRASQDVLLAFNNGKNERLSVITIKDLRLDEPNLVSDRVSFISSVDAKTPYQHDQLLIENMEQAVTPANEFSNLLNPSQWRINNDYLKLPLLIARLKKHRIERDKALSANAPLLAAEASQKIKRCYTDILRRVSIALAAFTFTLTGVAFGMEISRHHSKKWLVSVIGLTALFLTSIFIAKSQDSNLWLSLACYTFPHLFILFFACRKMQQISGGIE
ncbi:LptF/LptG family permease [Simkania negevensis]|uniref:LptF/LptG family permease n=1 Tax=Simkania negevensis TaxID=83561 RepID=A0ABS3AQW1_9BACT|nr:LptF/LptG family permease [Simkania negevensis]